MDVQVKYKQSGTEGIYKVEEAKSFTLRVPDANEDVTGNQFNQFISLYSRGYVFKLNENEKINTVEVRHLNLNNGTINERTCSIQ